MTLFHQKLEKMAKLVKEGKNDEAKGVLDAHIDADHHFMSDLAGLQGAISAYQQQLRNLRGWWGLFDNSPKTTKKSLATFEAMVKEAKNQLNSVNALIIKLRSEARLGLK